MGNSLSEHSVRTLSPLWLVPRRTEVNHIHRLLMNQNLIVGDKDLENFEFCKCEIFYFFNPLTRQDPDYPHI